MTEQAYPTLEGMAPSWADVSATLTIGGGALIETPDFAALNCGSTVEVGEQRGASGGRVLRRTTGSKTDEGSITYYRSGLKTLLRGLVSSAPTRGNQRLVSLVHFDVLIQYTPPGDTDIYTTKLKSCRLIGMTLGLTEGNEADKVEVPLSVGEFAMIIDGQEVVLI